ncbi:hypothetical protein QF012_003899 [Pseudomonas laurylsulfatiphila]
MSLERLSKRRQKADVMQRCLVYNLTDNLSW